MSAKGQDGGQLGNPRQPLLDHFMYRLTCNPPLLSQFRKPEFRHIELLHNQVQRANIERGHKNDHLKQIGAGKTPVGLGFRIAVTA